MVVVRHSRWDLFTYQRRRRVVSGARGYDLWVWVRQLSPPVVAPIFTIGLVKGVRSWVK